MISIPVHPDRFRTSFCASETAKAKYWTFLWLHSINFWTQVKFLYPKQLLESYSLWEAQGICRPLCKRMPSLFCSNPSPLIHTYSCTANNKRTCLNQSHRVIVNWETSYHFSSHLSFFPDQRDKSINLSLNINNSVFFLSSQQLSLPSLSVKCYLRRG